MSKSKTNSVVTDVFIHNAFHFKKLVISCSFHFWFKIIQIFASIFKLKSSVMLGVFKIQDVFLGSWETVRHRAPMWLHSLQCWTDFCRLLVRWEAGKKHKKELMCSWKKDTRGSQTFYLASPVLKERFLSLCSFYTRDFTLDVFLPLTVQNLSNPFPDTFSPVSPSERLQKRFFPIAKGTRHGLSYSPCIWSIDK